MLLLRIWRSLWSLWIKAKVLLAQFPLEASYVCSFHPSWLREPNSQLLHLVPSSLLHGPPPWPSPGAFAPASPPLRCPFSGTAGAPRGLGWGFHCLPVCGQGAGAVRWLTEKRLENDFQGWTHVQLVNTCCEDLHSISSTDVKIQVWWSPTVTPVLGR